MTIDALWVAAAQRSKLPREGVLAVYPKGIAVLLLHKDGEVYAVANRCAHMACPLEGICVKASSSPVRVTTGASTCAAAKCSSAGMKLPVSRPRGR